jgi:hypothetical protein
MSAQTVQISSMARIGDKLYFVPQALIAVDLRDYTADDKDRQIALYLAACPEPIIVNETEADAFKLMWDQITGQAHIQPAPAGLKLT